VLLQRPAALATDPRTLKGNNFVEEGEKISSLGIQKGQIFDVVLSLFLS